MNKLVLIILVVLAVVAMFKVRFEGNLRDISFRPIKVDLGGFNSRILSPKYNVCLGIFIETYNTLSRDGTRGGLCFGSLETRENSRYIDPFNLGKIEYPADISQKVSDSSDVRSNVLDKKLYSPDNKYYAIQKYLRSEQVTCCGNDELFEHKIYSVSIFRSETNTLIKEFTELNCEGCWEGYTPTISKWYSDDILQMFGNGIVDGFSAIYTISEDKLQLE
jgi:hypothetical protein